MSSDYKRKLEKTVSTELKRLKKDEISNNLSFSNCPHEILLLIFKYLNIREICQMARFVIS